MGIGLLRPVWQRAMISTGSVIVLEWVYACHACSHLGSKRCSLGSMDSMLTAKPQKRKRGPLHFACSWRYDAAHPVKFNLLPIRVLHRFCVYLYSMGPGLCLHWFVCLEWFCIGSFALVCLHSVVLYGFIEHWFVCIGLFAFVCSYGFVCIISFFALVSPGFARMYVGKLSFLATSIDG